MIAELNQNDIDNIRIAVDKMKGVNFDAARKMELLLDAYEKRDEDDSELEELQGAVEALPGWSGGRHDAHVESVSDMLDRANTAVSKWADSKDDEPLDEAVKRLVKKVDDHSDEVSALKDKLEGVFHSMLDIIGQEPKELSTLRNLVVKSLELLRG